MSGRPHKNPGNEAGNKAGKGLIHPEFTGCGELLGLTKERRPCAAGSPLSQRASSLTALPEGEPLVTFPFVTYVFSCKEAPNPVQQNQ